jgi:conjugative transfer signal peptidase TraF
MRGYRIRNSKPLIIAFGVFLFLAVVQVILCPSGCHFFLNLTGSEPRGVYLQKPCDGTLHRGDLVFMKCPPGFEKFVYGREWLPNGWPLLKTVRGIPGDGFCVSETYVSVEGKRIGPVYSFDRQGHPLPILRGCRTVPQHHFLPIATGLDNSFDGRYFGAVDDSLIIGKALPIISF